MKNGNITVILPTKNHEKAIVENITRLKKYLKNNFSNYQILIMSNGSSSYNKNLIEKTIKNEEYIEIYFLKKLGKGNAVKNGISLSKFDNVLIFDADFSYDIELLEKFYIDFLPRAPFIYATRKISKNLFKSTKLNRLVAGYVFNKIIRIYFKIQSSDTQAGFKLIDKSVFTNCSDFISDDYMYDVELFILANKLNINPLPIKVTSINLTQESNIRLLEDSFNMFLSLYKLRKIYFPRDINKLNS